MSVRRFLATLKLSGCSPVRTISALSSPLPYDNILPTHSLLRFASPTSHRTRYFFSCPRVKSHNVFRFLSTLRDSNSANSGFSSMMHFCCATNDLFKRQTLSKLDLNSVKTPQPLSAELKLHIEDQNRSPAQSSGHHAVVHTKRLTSIITFSSQPTTSPWCCLGPR